MSSSHRIDVSAPSLPPPPTSGKPPPAPLSSPPIARRRHLGERTFDRVVPAAEMAFVVGAEPVGPRVSDGVCAYLGIRPAGYEEAMLRRCLYPRARLLRPVLTWWNRNFFQPDLDFIRRVAGIRRREDLVHELDEFFYHPRNGSGLRRRFRLRLSSRRLVALIREALPELGAPGSARTPARSVYD